MESSENFNLDQWYRNNYNRINATAVPGSFSNKILHRLIERPFKSNAGFHILEVGANIGEHLPFVVDNFEAYLMTDIRPMADHSVSDVTRGKSLGGLSFQVADVHKLPFGDNSFDRVISTCLFHHLDSPIDAFREVRRVTKIGGFASILIPNDPGVVYRGLRKMTTLREAKKLGLYGDMQLVHALEHRNHYLQLITIANHVFKNDDLRFAFFPFKFRSFNLNALTVLQVKKL